MKKILLLTTVLLLTGCQSAHIEAVSNEALFKINDETVYEKDVFDAMHLSNGSVQIVKSEAQKLMVNELIAEDAEYEAAVKSKLSEAKASLGDNFELFLSENGFETEQDYVDEIIKDIVKTDLALKKAMIEDYDALTKLRPRQVRVVELDESVSKEALDAAKSGTSLEEIAKSLARPGTLYDGKPMIVSENSSLNVAPLNELLNKEEPGLIETLVPASSGDFQYLLEVVSVDTEAIKDEVIETFSQDMKLSDQYLAKMFIENNFKLYDQILFDKFKNEYPDFIK